MSEILVNSLKTAGGVGSLTFDSTGDVLLTTGRFGRVAGNTITIDSDGILNAASVNVSSAITLPAGAIDSAAIGTGAVSANKIASGAVEGAMTTQFGRRNIIINGAMQVAQRGTSSTGITSSGYYTCDRWETSLANLGTFTMTQESDAPDGFTKSAKWECTTADASPASGDIFYASYRIEGQDVQHLGYGGSSPKSVTISFYVKSNKTGTYQFNLRNLSANNMISGTYEINSSATWEYKTFTFSGSADAFDDNNDVEMFLEWALGAGSNFTTGSVPTSWETRDNTDRQAGQDVNLADTVGNYWQITGVQLEVGTVATPFEHRSYGEELALCQRYCYRIQGTTAYSAYWTGGVHSGSQLRGVMSFPVEMRSSPSLTHSDISEFRVYDGVNNGLATSMGLDGFTGNGIRFYVDTSSNTTGNGGYIQAANSPFTAFIQFDAEL